ncbi:glycosyltransferase family 1 protein [Proteus mirabilis]|uniref:glycosyltransferase family 4 protein n=1 Tax=Proteus mirabilis TaxID=584 RepID=UPI000F5C78D8|nr:glycosyltransferase family 4 protein [Proteus mirabilis]AZG97134.1 glycosyltransferase family 1 protein [Proteus mirabilis]HBC8711662.1 glycosyltransferase family 4 protein [Proteus mirabilis]
MIKIAHIQLLPLLSGAQKVSLEELQRLDPKIYDRYLICKEPGPLSFEAEKNNIKCIYIKNLVREISFKNDVLALIKLIKVIKKLKFDIIHTHSSKPGVLGRIAAFISRVPLIIHTVHGYSFPAAKNKLQYYIYLIMEYIGAQSGNLLICLHEKDKNIAIKKLRIKDKNIFVLANGVNVEKYKPNLNRPLIRKSLNFSHDDIIIGMTGRLWEQKNPMLLLYAFDKIINKDNLKLLFIGDGELNEKMIDFINEKNISNNVIMLGWREDTDQLLNSLDIFVLPSNWEGMPLAILEAKSCGLPCIVSNISGNNNLIDNEKTGLLFEPNNSDDLKKKIELLINNKETRELFGNANRVDILTNYNIDDRIEKINKLYQSFLNKH